MPTTTSEPLDHHARWPRSSRTEADRLALALRQKVRGEVRFDHGARALYANDSSIYRQVPIGVVIPRDEEDVLATVALCREFGAPVLPRGCGTSVTGQSCNVAVILDCSKYFNRILELDPERQLARVQPGVICDQLRDAARSFHQTFAPDPATHSRATLGGMLGNDSCGVHSQMGGKTSDNVVELDVLTYDGVRLRVGRTSDGELERIIAEGGRRGEIYGQLRDLRDRYGHLVRARFPDIPRRVSGYNLDQLLPEHGFNLAAALVGTEGTCVTILEATVRLMWDPPHHSLLVLGYEDAYAAADHVPEVASFGPIGLEGFDQHLLSAEKKKQLRVENMRYLPPGNGWLLVEFGGAEKAEADEKAHRLMEALRRQRHTPAMKLYDDAEEEHAVWLIRESGVGAVSAVPDEPLTWPSWEDTAVAPEVLGNYLRDFRALLERYGYQCAFFGHFGQGCVHCRIDFDLRTVEGIRRFRRFMYEGTDLVMRYGGSLTGEHGDGQAHAELLPRLYGSELVNGFREFKGIWDPERKMNPGKVVDGYRMDQNLRTGPHFDPAPVKTHFAFAEDHGSFAHATLRCIGIGKCRRLEGEGTMCPSFMVTREEKDTTRGRARLLFEMLQGDPIGGWRSEAVKDSLDLCLSCKGCKHDCPTRVDMATYKAEFLSHYYQGRLRPRAAYAMGFVFRWARLGALAPGLFNLAARAPGVGAAAKWLGGIAQQREIPALAPRPFRAWFARRAPRNHGAREVVLWPDTFTNYFEPEIAQAAVEVLEAAGFHVRLPRQTLCCGRPLYDFGMLETAQRHLRAILDALRPQIQAGLPVVGLEPSCVSVFRDELINLFPNDNDASRLSRQSYLLSEFLQEHAPDFVPPKLRRKALVHGHCHHKAIMTMRAENALLDQLGLDYQELDAGCCGMAGSFGFEAGDKYEVSIKCGERVLLPAVRAADAETLIIADGFSCRQQIAQTTERRALHLAQVLQMALREGDQPPHPFPEQVYAHNGHAPNGREALRALAAAGVGAAALGGALSWGLRATHRR